MHDIQAFGLAVLLWALVGGGALLGRRVATWLRIPAAALFLVVAAIAGSASTDIRNAVDLRDVEDVVTIALVVILFDGGLHLGGRRFRAAASPILLLGTLGTFATMGVTAVLAHVVFGLAWKLALVLGAALAPTDPAVVFAVLADTTLTGRTREILEGESGFNDPAGIALLLGFVHVATHAHANVAAFIGTFALAMGVGVAVGVTGGRALGWLLSRGETPALQPLRALAGILVLYGVATIAHGSGFLAVLVAGLVMGDGQASYGRSVEEFHATLAGLGEIVAFVLLGLTVHLHALAVGYNWAIGLGLAALLALVVRPLVCLPLLAPMGLRRGERTFIAWAGLKGAVPILLGALAVTGGVPDAQRLYALVFLVVAVSVVVQGGSLPWAAKRLGVAE